MKRRLTVALLLLAQCSSAVTAPPSAADIQAAVDEAAKEYLGDFPPDRIITTVLTDGSRFIFTGPPFELRLARAQSLRPIDIQPINAGELFGFPAGSSDSAVGTYFVFSPVPEATVYCQWIISARVRFPDWEGGDG